jgi:pimeloyl-ACP methyl ester carboxylesterase
MNDGVIFDRELRVRSGAGTPLWVGVVGRGPAVVLCDGLGCDGYVWKHMIADLRENFTVVRWHYRGHGRSETPPDLRQMTIAGLASDLFLVLDELGIDRAVLAGHSMGVQVLLEAALSEQAARVAGLLLVCGAPGRPLDTFKNSSFGARALPVIRDLARRDPAVFRRLWTWGLRNPLTLVATHLFEINSTLLNVEEMRPYLERLSSMDPLAFLAMLDDASRHTAEGRLDEVRTPTLVVAAERDTFTPMRRSVTMHEEIEGSELFVLPDATHTGPLEWPEMLNLRIRRFLATRLGEFLGTSTSAA